MNMEIIVFYFFAGIAVLAAIGVVSIRNPIHSALCLAAMFVALAALYVLLNAPFIAAAQVMIYAGAILILFVFVIMLLSPGVDQGAGALPAQPWLAGIFGLALVGLLVIVSASVAVPEPRSLLTGDVESLGALLFTDFALPFEITSFLLLAAIVGVIVLAKRTRN